MKRTIIITVAICVAIAIACFMIFGGEGVTPLMKASKSGNVAEVDRLISKDVELDKQSRYGWTALMFAAWQGHEDVARALLNAGADPNIKSGTVPSAFQTVGGHPPSTALQEAVRNHHLNLAKILINGGADIDAAAVALAARGGHLEFLKYLKTRGTKFGESSGNAFYATPLCAAAASGETETVRWLLENGASPNQLAIGQTALKEAAYHDEVEIVDLLLRHGADPNLVYGSTTETALYTAVTKYTQDHDYQSNISTIQLLLKHGADRNHKAFNGQDTALDTILVQKTNSEKYLDDNDSAEVKKRVRASLEHKKKIIEILRANQPADS